jgi:hypothetical protein
MKNKLRSFPYLLFLSFIITSCISYPDCLKVNLQLAGQNRNELKKVIRHYSSRSDSLKRKAAIFLIGNMENHYSYVSKKWDSFQVELDTLFKKEDRGIELYNGFNTLYDKYSIGVKDITYVSDLQTMSAKYLIYNIDQAFKTWESPYCNYLNFDDFCEYILPYRVGTEPLCDWKAEFSKRFLPNLYAKLGGRKESITAVNICDELKSYPYNTITFFPGNIPDYNVHLLTVMRLGSCRYFSIQALFAARCMGIPVALDYTPQWATRSFGHEWNALITRTGKPLSFGIGDHVELGKHIENVPDRIPAKVYRETFATQRLSLAMIHGNEDIPPTLASPCIKDVTNDYYATTDVSVKPLITIPTKNKFVYLSVFDNKNWIPVAWTKVEKNGYLFQNVNRDIVCLPSFYSWGGVFPAAYPVILRKVGTTTVLKPDLNKRETVILKRKYQDRMCSYLGFAMLGGRFQLANDSTFKDAIDIYKISVKPEQYYQIVNINPTKKYKYFRYLAPEKTHGEVAEIEVYEVGSKNKLSGKLIGNDTLISKSLLINAFDGDPLTRFSTKGVDGTWVGLKFNAPKSIDRIVYLPFNDDNCIDNNQLYELFYWDNKWISLGKQKGSSETYRLVYDNVPSNALLLLRNLTKGEEERIFTYENGEQVWW